MPKASLNLMSSSLWVDGGTLPSRRKIINRSRVRTLSILNIEDLFRPVSEKSGWDSDNTKSASVGSSGITEEMKATLTSTSFFAEITTAGLIFSFERSVNPVRFHTVCYTTS